MDPRSGGRPSDATVACCPGCGRQLRLCWRVLGTAGNGIPIVGEPACGLDRGWPWLIRLWLKRPAQTVPVELQLLLGVQGRG